mmetsp:Transcript_38175/g.93794  ORF Transcript_38175/g.93794 Transcript_38175/m.93794 type:complete len:242 (-) Transcript_38175:1749-2474(-)
MLGPQRWRPLPKPSMPQHPSCVVRRFDLLLHHPLLQLCLPVHLGEPEVLDVAEELLVLLRHAHVRLKRYVERVVHVRHLPLPPVAEPQRHSRRVGHRHRRPRRLGRRNASAIVEHLCACLPLVALHIEGNSSLRSRTLLRLALPPPPPPRVLMNATGRGWQVEDACPLASAPTPLALRCGGRARTRRARSLSAPRPRGSSGRGGLGRLDGGRWRAFVRKILVLFNIWRLRLHRTLDVEVEY